MLGDSDSSDDEDACLVVSQERKPEAAADESELPARVVSPKNAKPSATVSPSDESASQDSSTSRSPKGVKRKGAGDRDVFGLAGGNPSDACADAIAARVSLLYGTTLRGRFGLG